jgi:hypothetical protein
VTFVPQSSPGLRRLPASIALVSAIATGLLGAQQRQRATAAAPFLKEPGGLRLGSLVSGVEYPVGRSTDSWTVVTIEGWIPASAAASTTRDGFNLTVIASGGCSILSGTVTMTTTTKSTNPINDVNPCAPADPIAGVSQDNIVEHVTIFPAGDEVWATFTDTAKVTVTDQVTGVVYTGHATFWGNFNLNERNSNSTFTQTIAVKGSDGSTIHVHETAHFTLNANGVTTVTFDTITVTCG